MSKLIGFGKCSKYYLYILYTVIIKAIKDIIFGFIDIDQRNKEEFIIISPVPLFNQHTLLKNLFRYLGFILGGFIFEKLVKKRNSSKDIENKTENLGIELIYNKIMISKKQIYYLIIIAIIYCIYYELKKLLYLMNFYYLDFWPINIIYILVFMNLYFKIEFYNYKKCSLFFIVITNMTLLLINTFLPQPRDPGKRNEYDIYRDTMGNAGLFVPFLLLFIFIYCIISYARVKIKVMATFQFISNYVIIIVIGICGIILTIIEIIFSETIKCNRNQMKEAFRPLCLINTTENDYYYDELKKFFVDFRNLSSINIFINILLMLFYLIINFFEILCELLIIYHLNPIYILIRNNIYNFVLRIMVVLIRAKIDIGAYMTPRFFILESAEILALLGECIYLQLIELKFCNFDVNLNKNIIVRSNKESVMIPLEIKSEDSDNKDNFEDDNKIKDTSSKSLDSSSIN